MEKALLSCKNIYRLLTAADYPMYSAPVITERSKRGLTLIRFWSGVLPRKWRDTPCGRLIWRAEGSRNRYFSEICNRKTEFPLYKTYMEEILALPGLVELDTLMNAFLELLAERRADEQGLKNRLAFFRSQIADGDDAWGKETEKWIAALLSGEKGAVLPLACVNAWQLTVLTLAAIGGEPLPERARWLCERLLSGAVPAKDAKDDVKLLTKHYSSLRPTDPSLDDIYGRETELFDLKELLRQRAKILLSGMGGVGKTYLLQALIGWIVSSGSGQKIAIVPFEGSLVGSLIQSFRCLTGKTALERFHECLYLLEEQDPKKTLLVIDDLQTEKLSEEEKQILKELPCSILASSRSGELDGFVRYPVRPVSAQAAALIFRRHYGLPMTKQEKTKLVSILEENQIQIPLLLRFLGTASKKRGWKSDELEKCFRREGWQISSLTRKGNSGLREAFRQISDTEKMPEIQKELIRLLAVLPFRAYSGEWIFSFFPPETREEREKAMVLLEEAGWLSREGDCWLLHPVIAESVCMERFTEEEFPGLWKRGREHITEDLLETCSNAFFLLGKEQKTEDQEREAILEELHLILDASCKLREPVSSEIERLQLQIIYLLMQSARISPMAYDLETRFLTERGRTQEAEIYRRLCMVYILEKEIPGTSEIETYRRCAARGEIPEFLFALLVTGSLVSAHRVEEIQVQEELLSQAVQYLNEKKVPEYIAPVIWVLQAESLARGGQYEECLGLLSQAGRHAERFGNRDLQLYCSQRKALIRGFQEDLEGALLELKECSEFLDSFTDWSVRADYENTCAWIAGVSGDAQAGISSLQSIRTLYLRYQGRKGINAILAASNLGTAYAKAGMYREAIEIHEEALRDTQGKENMDPYYHMLVYNNAAVAYLDAGMPGRAATLLEISGKDAPAIGDLAVAENQWNMSRVHRSRGETEQERACLDACIPVFEKNYGEEHSKTLRAKERRGEI